MIQMLLQTYLSIHHAKSAAHFVRCANQVKVENIRLSSEIGVNVSAAILSSIAFLEATVNELFSEAESDSNKWLKNITIESKKLITTLSNIDSIDRASILEKYEIFLVSANLEPIPKGSKIYQNIKEVIYLRNKITHYKASWLDAGSEELLRNGSSHKTDYWKRLNKLVFLENSDNKAHTWEQKEYASWALKSSIDFVEEIFNKLGVSSNINHVRAELEF
jgi:hypothetical protein